MKVLISGATGFVGSRIVDCLAREGHELVILTRDPQSALEKFSDQYQYFSWKDPKQTPDPKAFEVDAVIHLAGENIANKRWTNAQKKKIYESRVDGTASLMKGVQASHRKPIFISTSAIGVYGDKGLDKVDEQGDAADDFLARVCQDWEAEAQKGAEYCSRLAILRVGVVLGKGGGALLKLLPLFKLGLGGPVANGKQIMSWIHVDDLAALYVEALKNENYSGVLNATAPNPVSNKEFTKSLGKAVSRPAFFVAPAFALKLAMGEMSQIVLDSCWVVPAKAQSLGFTYRFGHIDQALENIVHQS